jgi:hypothetical protein
MTITTSGRQLAGFEASAGGGRAGATPRPLRAFLARSAVLAVPAAALLVTLSGPASAATLRADQSAQPASTAITWHALKLVNGWKSSQGSYDTGNPAYAVSRGVVYLAGSLHGGATATFAVLPRAARPDHRLVLAVYTVNGSRGTLQIMPDGRVAAASTPSTNATLYTSLAGVSYPTAAIALHKLALVNGWTPSKVPANTGAPAYAIQGHVVYLSGALHGGTDPTFAVLPKAARPAYIMYRPIATVSGSVGAVVIEPQGLLGNYSPLAHQLTSIAGVSYPAAGVTWHKLTLLNGWQSGQQQFTTGDPAYAIIGGVVYLSGALHRPSGTNTQFALLPKAARPAHVLYLTTHNIGQVGTVRIEPDGRVFAYSVPDPGSAPQFTSLAAISYPHNS